MRLLHPVESHSQRRDRCTDLKPTVDTAGGLQRYVHAANASAKERSASVKDLVWGGYD